MVGHVVCCFDSEMTLIFGMVDQYVLVYNECIGADVLAYVVP